MTLVSYNLRRLLKEKNLRANSLLRAGIISSQALSDIIHCKTGDDIRLSTVMKIAGFFGVSTDELIKPIPQGETDRAKS